MIIFYGSSALSGDSGAVIYGELESEPELLITDSTMINGKNPILSVEFLPSAATIEFRE